MNTPSSPETSPAVNKLLVRSEVVAVINHLASHPNPAKQDLLKQLKRLNDLNAHGVILDILIKELSRAIPGPHLQVITEFLMELGTIELLQDKLWSLIKDPKISDESKDAANLVLRHLGDPTDPDLYLQYLKDPQGLIGRETSRMLEVSTENPEAVIDFIDFILSLPPTEQIKLIHSLHEDYPEEYLVHLFIPLLECDPSPEVAEELIHNLGESRAWQALACMDRLLGGSDEQLGPKKRLMEQAVRKLQMAGAKLPEDPLALAAEHPLLAGTKPFECYSTLADGMGNQGLIISVERPNGDITMMSLAVNDTHGIIDAFGFFQLTTSDFYRICDKFNEGVTKFKVSPDYMAWKVAEARAKNTRSGYRVPYEFSCWQPIIAATAPMPALSAEFTRLWVNTEWYSQTNNLYQHPDLNSWFLEAADHPILERILGRVSLIISEHINVDNDEQGLKTTLEGLAEELADALLDSDWRTAMTQRLREAAYLFDLQNTHTFRTLAATEAHKLENESDPLILKNGFVRTYSRKCLVEELLRLETQSAQQEPLAQWTEAILKHWDL